MGIAIKYMVDVLMGCECHILLYMRLTEEKQLFQASVDSNMHLQCLTKSLLIYFISNLNDISPNANSVSSTEMRVLEKHKNTHVG